VDHFPHLFIFLTLLTYAVALVILYWAPAGKGAQPRMWTCIALHVLSGFLIYSTTGLFAELIFYAVCLTGVIALFCSGADLAMRR
jgi:hypothetical protein